MRRTKEAAGITKDTILDAGLKVFAKVGYEKATLANIGSSAGVTRGAIYWHFNNKKNLFEQIVRREKAALAGIVEPILRLEIPPFKKLKQLLFSVIDNFHSSGNFRLYIELTWYKLGIELFEETMRYKTEYVQWFLYTMDQLLQESILSKEIREDTDVSTASYHLSCLINGFYRLYFAAPGVGRDKQKTMAVFEDYFNTLSNS